MFLAPKSMLQNMIFPQILPQNVFRIFKAAETKQIYLNESGKLSGNACAYGGREMSKIREM